MTYTEIVADTLSGPNEAMTVLRESKLPVLLKIGAETFLISNNRVRNIFAKGVLFATAERWQDLKCESA